MLRPALLILLGNSASSLILLLRNLIVARLISVEDYGIAATFAITMAVVEMMSQLGLQQQIVQARDGNGLRFQAALQGFQLVRGAVGAIVLFALAWPLANFLNYPQLSWAYQVMAVVPVLNAFVHFDVHRLNRKMLFWPLVLTGAVPSLISLLAIWPLLLLFGDFRVMLFAIVLQAAMTAITSQLVARRRYRLAFDPKIAAASLRFGWPLLINSALLFAVFNGDKLLIGRVLGMNELAIFAMGITLTLTPTLVMAKSAQSFFLPQLSKIDRSTSEGSVLFQRLAIVTMQTSILSGVILVLAVICFGKVFVWCTLGQNYAPLVPLLAPLAVLQALRVAKAGCSVTALSSGHTTNAMYSNILRLASLPLAWYFLANGAGLRMIIHLAVFAEALGYLISLFLVFRRPGINLRPIIGSIFFLLTFLILTISVETGLDSLYLAVLPVLLVLLIWTMQDFRHYVVNHLRKF